MYKNIILFVLSLLLIVSCDDGGDSSNNTSSIVGTWVYVYPSSGCVESYIFNGDGTWSESALDEIQTGTYTFEESVNVSGRYALSILITSDNGLSDCNGVSSDSTGVSGTVYAAFPNSSTMEWYLVETGNMADLVLTKQ